MIKNIVFDLGNVLLRFDPIGFLRELGYDEDRVRDLKSLIFDSPTWRLADQGLISIEDHTQVYLNQAPHYETEIRYLMQHWVEMPTLIDESARLFQACVDQGFKVYILSNYPQQGFNEMWESTPLLHQAHGAVISYRIKLVKPMPEIYHYLLDTYGLDPKETVFMDDLHENISAACAVGIRGIQFKCVTQAKEALLELGVEL